MRIIGLYGASNTGKTTTLNLVANDLEKSGANILSHERVYESSDYRYYIQCPNRLKLCITTAGDNKTIQQENVDFVAPKENKVDIWITASRTSGESTLPMVTFANDQKTTILWVRKLSPIIIDQSKGYKYENDRPSIFGNSICDRLNRIDSDRILNMVFQETT